MRFSKRLLSAGLGAAVVAAASLASIAGATHLTVPADSTYLELTGPGGDCLFTGASVTLDPPGETGPTTQSLPAECGGRLTIAWEGTAGEHATPINEAFDCGADSIGRRLGVITGHDGYLKVLVTFDPTPLNPASGDEEVLDEAQITGPTEPTTYAARFCAGLG